MMVKTHKALLICRLTLIAVVALSSMSGKTQEQVTYLVLAETVEPIMIVRDGNPMAGGIMTEIVDLMFKDSDYIVEPLVLPWQRMAQEFNDRDD